MPRQRPQSPRRAASRSATPARAPAPDSLLRTMGDLLVGITGMGCAVWVFLAYFGVVG